MEGLDWRYIVVPLEQVMLGLLSLQTGDGGL